MANDKMIWNGKFGDFLDMCQRNPHKAWTLQRFEYTITEPQDETEDLILFIEKMIELFLNHKIPYSELNDIGNKKWINEIILRNAIFYIHLHYPHLLQVRELPGTSRISYICKSINNDDKYGHQTNSKFCLNSIDKTEILDFIIQHEKNCAIQRNITGPLLLYSIFVDDNYNKIYSAIEGEFNVNLNHLD